MARKLARWWFVARAFPIRVSFAAGKASFVEADVMMTTHSVADVGGTAGRTAAPCLLAHFGLRTAPPRSGVAGWRVFEERVAFATPHRTIDITCRYCRHHFIVQLSTTMDPLAGELTGGKSPAAPASYASDWFGFTHENYEGPTWLSCPHCEQRGMPDLALWVSA